MSDEKKAIAMLKKLASKRAGKILVVMTKRAIVAEKRSEKQADVMKTLRPLLQKAMPYLQSAKGFATKHPEAVGAGVGALGGGLMGGMSGGLRNAILGMLLGGGVGAGVGYGGRQLGEYMEDQSAKDEAAGSVAHAMKTDIPAKEEAIAGMVPGMQGESAERAAAKERRDSLARRWQETMARNPAPIQ